MPLQYISSNLEVTVPACMPLQYMLCGTCGKVDDTPGAKDLKVGVKLPPWQSVTSNLEARPCMHAPAVHLAGHLRGKA